MSPNDQVAQEPVWYFEQDGEAVGPLTSTALRKLAAKNVVAPDTRLRRGETADWVQARQVKGLFPDEPIVSVEQMRVQPLSEGGGAAGKSRRYAFAGATVALILLLMVVLVVGWGRRGPRPVYGEIVQELLSRKDSEGIAAMIDSLILSDFLTAEEIAAMDAAKPAPARSSEVKKYVGVAGAITFDTTHWPDSAELSSRGRFKRRQDNRGSGGPADELAVADDAVEYKSVRFATRDEAFSQRAISHVWLNLAYDGKHATASIQFSAPPDGSPPGAAGVSSIQMHRAIPNPNYAEPVQNERFKTVRRFTSYGVEIASGQSANSPQKPSEPQYISETLLSVSAEK